MRLAGERDLSGKSSGLARALLTRGGRRKARRTARTEGGEESESMQVSSAASVFARGTVALRRDRGAARGASRARALAAQPVVAAKAEAGKVKKVNSEELEKAIAEVRRGPRGEMQVPNDGPTDAAGRPPALRRSARSPSWSTSSRTGERSACEPPCARGANLLVGERETVTPRASPRAPRPPAAGAARASCSPRSWSRCAARRLVSPLSRHGPILTLAGASR